MLKTYAVVILNEAQWSEESVFLPENGEILRCAQNDNYGFQQSIGEYKRKRKQSR